MSEPGRGAPFLSSIRESNRQGRDAWSRYAGHRARLTRLVRSVAPPGGSLGVLGAGHANDLDLPALLRTSRAIHLIDIDGDAVRAGLVHQGLAAETAIVVHAPVDLTGILGALPVVGEAWGEAQTARIIASLGERRLVLPGGPFDVTISACVLTQLLQSVVDAALPPADRDRVSLALRDRHLADLLALTRPGGVAILATDVVATTTAPWLVGLPDGRLEEQMAGLVASANFFTGTNPYRIVALLEEDPRYRSRVAGVRLVGPWLWPVTRDRQHLTCAIVARFRNDDDMAGRGTT